MSRVVSRLVGMFRRPVRDVRGASLRVALVATAMVLVAYLAIATAVMLIVTRNLTTAVDNRLHGSLSGTRASASDFPSTGLAYQEPLLRWVVIPGGDTYFVGPGAQLVPSSSQTPSEALPPAARDVTSPTTVKLSDGSDLRADAATTSVDINGQTVSGARLIVGQSLDNVSTTQSNILTAELLVGPILLLAVFLGALAIGRRVGAPIERARQRQIEMTADASHELRTPLSVIEAQTSLALERERDVAWYRNAFASVGVESKRMRHLVDDLLWLARFDSTGAAPTSEATDLGVLAASAATRFEAVAQARGLTLSVVVEPVSTMISAPPEWLDRLLGVLLDNACRYTPAGGTVDVRVGRREGRVRLVVDDSGPGIPLEERRRIFDRFRRASDAPGGSGLGLAIAAAVVSSSGGRWDVDTSTTGGASMAVTWTPLIRDGSETESSAAIDQVTKPASGMLAPPPPPRPA
jgi:signal transduction histidine kinase